MILLFVTKIEPKWQWIWLQNQSSVVENTVWVVIILTPWIKSEVELYGKFWNVCDFNVTVFVSFLAKLWRCDQYQSIPNFRSFLKIEEFRRQKGILAWLSPLFTAFPYPAASFERLCTSMVNVYMEDLSRVQGSVVCLGYLAIVN